MEFTNPEGLKWLVQEGAKLYDGYQIRTAQESHAYIDLDADKAVKLDHKNNNWSLLRFQKEVE